MLSMGSAGSALPGLQQGSDGNNPRYPQEWAGMVAGSRLLWRNVEKGGDASKYIKICCGRPFLFQSDLQGAV